MPQLQITADAGNGTVLPNGALFRIGTLQGLLGLANYAGIIPVSEVAKYGGFGLGTYHDLNGEMIVDGGVFYQALSNGVVQIADPNIKVPFALVTRFQPQVDRLMPQNLNFASTATYLSEQFPDQLSSYAFRIYGQFKQLLVRAVARQDVPYSSDIEASGFSHSGVRGIMTGFRFPLSKSGTTGEGYHFHFLSDDKQQGGHVLDFELDEGASFQAQHITQEFVGEVADIGGSFESSMGAPFATSMMLRLSLVR